MADFNSDDFNSDDFSTDGDTPIRRGLLEFTMPETRLHFAMPDTRLEFTLEAD